MPKKIDPLNKKQYGAVTAILIVSDIKAAVSFYQKALGFAKRAIMNGPDGKANTRRTDAARHDPDARA